MNTAEIIKYNEGTLVDRRTRSEFFGRSVASAMNIPLNEIPLRVDELKEMKAPVIFCCPSANRSGQSTNYVSLQGIEYVNGGSWLEVNYLTSQEV